MSTFCLCLDCQAGFNGGLPQTFLLEVRHNGLDLVANQSVTSRPFFKVLQRDLHISIRPFAASLQTALKIYQQSLSKREDIFKKLLLFFQVDGLAPDSLFTFDVYALNAKGRSKPVRLSTRTKKHQANVKYSFRAGMQCNFGYANIFSKDSHYSVFCHSNPPIHVIALPIINAHQHPWNF